MSKKRILYTSHLPHLELGGQISLYQLLKRLDRKTYRPIVIVPSTGSFSRALKEIGCELAFLTFPRIAAANLLDSFRCFIRTFRLLRTHSIHLVHSDHPTDTFYLAVCSKILGIPLVWHARVTYRSRLDRLNLLLARRLIGVSDAVSARFFARGRTSGKYVTIHNGVDPEQFKPGNEDGLRKELGFGSSESVVTTIGQLSTEKGIFDFIEAARLLSRRDPNCRFLIVGKGKEQVSGQVRDRIHAYGIEKRVSLLGFRTDVNRILNASDIFVLPSYTEGFPRTVIEAMSCGKPVVGSNVEGIREAIEDGKTGYLVPPGKPQKLAEAISYLLENQMNSKAMGQAGREKVLRLFTVEDHISKIQGVYREILDSHPRGKGENR